MNSSSFRKPVTILAFVFSLFVAASFTFFDTSGLVQPIAYNHNLHIEDVGAECIDCHKFVETSARASIPNIYDCVEGHDGLLGDSEEEKLVLKAITANRLLPWNQIHKVPDFVYFSHRRHVKLGKLPCETCHGEVSKMTTPFAEPFQEITMAWCTECHEKNEVTNDCYACHH